MWMDSNCTCRAWDAPFWTRRRPPAAIRLGLLALGALSCGAPPAQDVGGMFRGGPRHQGAYPDAPSGAGLIEWSFQTGGPIPGSVLVDSELVFVGSGDGYFYAIARASGAERWRFHVGAPVHSSAAARGDLVYFGDRANVLYALDRRSGRLRFKREMGSDLPWEWGREGWDYYTSSPVIAGDLVIIGSADGGVYAYDAETGAQRWRYATNGRVRSSPAVESGVVYVGSADGFLHAIDLGTGALKWRFETEGASNSSAEFGFDRKTIQSSPALAGRSVYFGSRDGKFYSVESGTGTLRWRYDHGTPWVVSSAAIVDGTVISSTSDGLFVHALDAEGGEELWRYATGHRVFSSPAVAGSTVFVGNQSGRFMALDLTSGELRWELRFSEPIMSSPVVADDRVYFGAHDGAVYAVRLTSAQAPRRAVYWDGEREAWNALGGHEGVRDYLASFGYEVIDRRRLVDFMQSAIGSGTPSVVVFAMDDLPTEVASVAADTVLAIRYLRAGGKIVWLGMPPLMLERGEDGGITGFDRAWPEALLGVSQARYNVDLFGAFPTAAGQRWGLTSRWVGISGVDPAGVSETLAVDENGGAAAWVKSYGGPPGSGFVFLWGTYRSVPHALYEPIRAVAERGIGVALRQE